MLVAGEMEIKKAHMQVVRNQHNAGEDRQADGDSK